MDTLNDHPEKIYPFRSVAGVVLILAGGILFVDRHLQTGWLSLAVLPAIGLFLFLWGVRTSHTGLIVAGGIFAGTGIGIWSAFNGITPPRQLMTQIGLLSLYSGFGWAAVVIATVMATSRPQWWALIPAGVFGSLGACILFSRQTWGDFVLYLSLGVAVPLLLWGLADRLFGLTIPGCLILGAGLGTYLGWQSPQVENGLVQTGVSLVWFGLGWMLITLTGRFILLRYIWWPLIPGGIIAVVGWGLYIGGDPDNALGFISNTGAIALMIFGLYLLLMRKGIHH